MHDIIMRLKSGREFRFKCEEYTIKTFKPTGTLSEFSYEGGVGECPVYFQEQDIECIAIIGKEQKNDNARAIELLKEFQLCCDFDHCTNAWNCDECVEALNMAIEALKKEPEWWGVKE